jgi:ribosomal protein L11 methylase PrmA
MDAPGRANTPALAHALQHIKDFVHHLEEQLARNLDPAMALGQGNHAHGHGGP